MTALKTSAPWHKESFDRFLRERLPQLLAERLPLLSYAVEATGTYTCRVTVTLEAASGALVLPTKKPPTRRTIAVTSAKAGLTAGAGISLLQNPPSVFRVAARLVSPTPVCLSTAALISRKWASDGSGMSPAACSRSSCSLSTSRQSAQDFECSISDFFSDGARGRCHRTS